MRTLGTVPFGTIFKKKVPNGTVPNVTFFTDFDKLPGFFYSF